MFFLRLGEAKCDTDTVTFSGESFPDFGVRLRCVYAPRKQQTSVVIIITGYRDGCPVVMGQD